jgi:glycosyltransferase involved in cell wall biosynthesis
MKILIPILGFGRAGGYRVLSQLATQWVRLDHSVDFLCPDSSDEPYFPTEAGVLWCDARGRLARDRSTGMEPGARAHLQALWLGLNAAGAGYDVILANQSLTAWPVWLARTGRARKTYYVQAYEPEYYLSRGAMRGLLPALLSALSYHLPLQRIVNASLYFRYRNLRARHAVPPGLDLSLFAPGAGLRDLRQAGEIVIGCIGRDEPAKGTIYALQAFEQLARRDPRYRLRVAYKVPAGWQHTGCEVVVPRNDQELAAFYRGLDVIIAAGTVQHGAPHYPVLEGGASGASVVTTGYMGATSETAWLVRNRDPASIVTAVEQLVANADERARRQALFLREVQTLSWSAVAQRMLSLFASEKAA